MLLVPVAHPGSPDLAKLWDGHTPACAGVSLFSPPRLSAKPQEEHSAILSAASPQHRGN